MSSTIRLKRWRSAVVTLAVAGIAAGTAAALGHPASSQLVFVRHQMSGTFVDVPPRGRKESQGDWVAFHSRLFDRSDSRVVGASDGTCVITDAHVPLTNVCTMTLTIPGGTIVAVGAIREASTIRFAVTGGTGAYADARGTLRIDNSLKPVARVTISPH